MRNGGCVPVRAAEAGAVINTLPTRGPSVATRPLCYTLIFLVFSAVSEFKMCTVFRITVASLVCVVLSSAHVHGPRRSRRMDVEDYAQNEIDSGRADESSWWPSAEFAVLQKVYDDCSAQRELTTCLKGKALTALTRAVEQVGHVTRGVGVFW